jgi:hypothetical protein
MAMPLTTTEVARALKVSYWSLLGLFRSALMEPPPKNYAGDFVWSSSHVEQAKKLLKNRGRARKEMATAG